MSRKGAKKKSPLKQSHSFIVTDDVPGNMGCEKMEQVLQALLTGILTAIKAIVMVSALSYFSKQVFFLNVFQRYILPQIGTSAEPKGSHFFYLGHFNSNRIGLVAVFHSIFEY